MLLFVVCSFSTKEHFIPVALLEQKENKDVQGHKIKSKEVDDKSLHSYCSFGTVPFRVSMKRNLKLKSIIARTFH